MLVKGSSILEFVEIDMPTFDSHDVGAVLSWATCSNVKDCISEHLAMPIY